MNRKNNAKAHLMESAFGAHSADIELAAQYLMILTWATRNPGKSPEVESALNTIRQIVEQKDSSRTDDLKMLTDACADIIIMLESEDHNRPATHLVQ